MKNTSKKYIVRGSGELLDGLLIHAYDTDYEDLLLVDRIEQPSQLFQTFSVPITGLFVDRRVLEEYEEPEEDFQTTNPYGTFVMDGSVAKAGVSVVWSLYEKAITVKVIHNEQSMFTNNFYGKDIKAVTEFLQMISQDPYYDMDDVVFDLRDRVNGANKDVE